MPGWGPLNLVLEGHFILPIYIDLAATFLFGLTGALAALKRGYDWVGLFALAFATAVGGGLIRDGIFILQGPPAVAKDSRYILVILAAAIVGSLFREHVIRFNKIIAWLDALGLGAYAVVGVQKSLNADLSVAAAILVGVINAAGGGCLRDVLVREEPLVFKPGQFYVLAAICGSLLFVLLTLQVGMEGMPAAAIAIAATFIFRVLAIQFNWKTSPVWQEPPEQPALRGRASHSRQGQG
jgi:uncharacterized membrane protein YeiH